MTDAPLPDGTYDAMVVEARDRPDGGTAIELTVLAGPHKGQVLELQGQVRGDALDLLGVPATVTVVDGHPRMRIET